MQYHAKLEFGNTAHYWWNKGKDGVVTELLIPFINGHVVEVKRSGSRRLLNMKSGTLLTVYKTRRKLRRPKPEAVPSEFKDIDFEEHNYTAEVLAESKASIPQRASSSLLQKAFSPPLPQVFVVMKFGDNELDSAYEGVIRPVIEENDLKAVRIDELQDSGRITDQVLESIAESQFVLSDLSGERPNCYYETGFAHALGRELILTIRDDDPIHFDLTGYRFIQWSTEADLRRKLRKRFASLVAGRQEQTAISSA